MGSPVQQGQPELLLVACESKDPYSVTIVDPKTCVSLWSYKGSELQGAEVGFVEPVGSDGNLMLVVPKKRPLVHCIAVNRHDRFNVRSVLNKPLEAVVITNDGAVVFGAIESNIFTWLISSGDLLSVIAAHYQNINCLCLSSDDGLLISGAEDGTVNVYLVSEILSWDSGSPELIKPYRQWHSHSLKVTSLSVTCLSNARVLSTSLDHVAAIHSVTMDECLLKITGDQALTASCFDPAEISVFLGTDKGVIFRSPLYSIEGISEKMICCDAENSDNNFYTGHMSTITELTVNHDASLLASGDSTGKYIVWDAFSKQCLRAVHNKGSICKLKFIHHWKSISQSNYPKLNVSIGVLQRSRPDRFTPTKMNLKNQKPSEFESKKNFVHDHLYKMFNKQLEEVLKAFKKQPVLVSNNRTRDSSSAGNDDNDVVLIEEDEKDDSSKTAGKSDLLMETDAESNEIVSLRMKNAELTSQIEQLKAELCFARKKNQEIFKFASELILESEKK